MLRYVRPGNGFVPNFDMFAKIEVNGAKEDPIFTMLKVKCLICLNQLAATRFAYFLISILPLLDYEMSKFSIKFPKLKMYKILEISNYLQQVMSETPIIFMTYDSFFS